MEAIGLQGPPTPAGYTKQWIPGTTTNPGGRPTKRTSQGVLESHYRTYVLEMLDIMVDLARNAKESNVRLSATIAYLDRALGKPMQEIRATLEDKRPIVVDGALGDIAAMAPQSRTEDQQEAVAEIVAQVVLGRKEGLGRPPEAPTSPEVDALVAEVDSGMPPGAPGQREDAQGDGEDQGDARG